MNNTSFLNKQIRDSEYNINRWTQESTNPKYKPDHPRLKTQIQEEKVKLERFRKQLAQSSPQISTSPVISNKVKPISISNSTVNNNIATLGTKEGTIEPKIQEELNSQTTGLTDISKRIRDCEYNINRWTQESTNPKYTPDHPRLKAQIQEEKVKLERFRKQLAQSTSQINHETSRPQSSIVITNNSNSINNNKPIENAGTCITNKNSQKMSQVSDKITSLTSDDGKKISINTEDSLMQNNNTVNYSKLTYEEVEDLMPLMTEETLSQLSGDNFKALLVHLKKSGNEGLFSIIPGNHFKNLDKNHTEKQLDVLFDLSRASLDRSFGLLNFAVENKFNEYSFICLDHIANNLGVKINIKDPLISVEINSPKVSFDELSKHLTDISKIMNCVMTIDLSLSSSANPVGLENFIKESGHLINFFDVRELGDVSDGLIEIIVKCCPNILHLFIRSNILQGNGLEFERLEQLQTLDIAHCQNIQTIPSLPRSLKILNIHGCSSLKKVAEMPKNLHLAV